MTDSAQIEEIINNFDYIKVHRVMKFLKWKVNGEVPSVGMLMLKSEKLLKECFKFCRDHRDSYTISTMGFVAEVEKITDCDDIEYRGRLSFEIESWSTFD